MANPKLKLTIDDSGILQYRLQHKSGMDILSFEQDRIPQVFKNLRDAWYNAAMEFYDTGNRDHFKPGINAPEVFVRMPAAEIALFGGVV